MSLRHLTTLVTIAEVGSFHAAAERLGITQSAVSMQMKALEDNLRVTLFDRTRRPPALNALGRSLLERARDLLLRYEALRQSALSGESVVGTLRLGVIPTVGSTLLPRALVDLGAVHPSLKLRIESDLSEALLTRVAQGALDVAIITGPVSINERHSARNIAVEALVVIAPMDPVTGDQPMEDGRALLSTRPFVRFDRRTGVGRIVDEALKTQRIPVREAMELNSVEAILAMVTRGLGVAVVPAGSISPAATRVLRLEPFGDPPVTRHVTLVEPQSRPLAALTEPLHDALRRAAADQLDGQDGIVK